VAKANTQQIVSIKDERLDIDHIDHYRLSFFIGLDSIDLAVKDLKTNRLLLFEHLVFNKSKDIIANLDQVHKEHNLIAAGFWKEIQVFVRNDKFALIPNPLFDKSKLYEYIRLNDKADLQQDAFHFKQLDDFGLSFAFGFMSEIREWFKSKYPKVNQRISHQGVAFLNAVQKTNGRKTQATMFLDIKDQKAMVAGFNFEKLAIYNQFSFKDAEHLVKLTALTCQQFSTDRDKTPLIVSGTKAQIEAAAPTLKKYFKLFEAAKRPVELQVHPVFNELEAYEYTEILANL